MARSASRERDSEVSCDPWGRPYMLVLGKLHPSAPPLNETRKFVNGVLDSPFPSAQRGERDNRNWSMDFERISPPSVTDEELHDVIKKMGSRDFVPLRMGFLVESWRWL